SDASALGSRAPLPRLLAELEVAEHWGVLRFIPHERLAEDSINEADWVVFPNLTDSHGPDAWHPLDMLVAPLYDADGVLRGTLSIDVPEDGRRPGPERRRMLERYAVVAGRAVVTAIERERLAEQVAMANTVKAIVRKTSAQLSLIGLLRESEQALVEGFRARGMWLQTFGQTDGEARLYAANGTVLEMPVDLRKIGEVAAYHCWSEQEVVIISADRPAPAMLTPAEHERILAFIDSISIDSLLFAPLGAGPECLGSLVLTRAASEGEWSDVECASLLDIGQDLGRAILNARSFEREHQLVKELQALDHYKGQLIATVSHELKNPLGAIIGHLEMLDSVIGPASRAGSSLAAMDRGAARMSRVIEDLLLLSKVGDPHHPIIPGDVDLAQLLDEVVDLTEVSARAKQLAVEVVVPERPVVARGEREELDKVVLNLVSNAVKYTPPSGRVSLTLSRVGEEVVLAVTDTGIGISETDQARLFDEFFRSADPGAVSQPGTGLGLAIAHRIVRRHGGRIVVDSALGAGSTFTVTLPAGTAGQVCR
ncbi:MAG: sensor histidine kinase, partial [Nocardioides sp.]